MSGHQWLHNEAGFVLTTSILEMTAVLNCAASLADKEGMHGTADRLRNDAAAVQRVHDTHDGPTVIIIQ